ncbi:hypothetical protein C8R31_101515 [Nitrosospira sp. Nsp2]|nr:hypothetical protein C8R31_101515 [Nitrosospira sp. Nsp2]
METGAAAVWLAFAFLAGTYTTSLHPADPLPNPCPSLCGMKSCRLLYCINRHSGVYGRVPLALPHHALTLRMAFLSGQIIMNSAVMDRRQKKMGGFFHS